MTLTQIYLELMKGLMPTNSVMLLHSFNSVVSPEPRQHHHYKRRCTMNIINDEQQMNIDDKILTPR